MSVRIAPWLTFFRLPNLPTAPGDAFAGAAIALAVTCGAEAAPVLDGMACARILISGAVALFLYLFGLADNDIVGYEVDCTQAPKRPLPAGEITLSQAKWARGICCWVAGVLGIGGGFSTCWWIGVVVLALLIGAYNRYKDRSQCFGLLSMGLCRGLSLLVGALVFVPATWDGRYGFAVGLAVVGWVGYIASVTALAAQEHRARQGLSKARYFPGLTLFIPLFALPVYPMETWALMMVCSLCAYGVWFLSVAPLGVEHTPAIRRRAVGQTIGALLYLQAAYMFAFPHPLLMTLVVVLFLCSALIRKYARGISGS